MDGIIIDDTAIALKEHAIAGDEKSTEQSIVQTFCMAGRNTPGQGGSTVFPGASVSAAASGEGWRTGSGGRLELFARRRSAVIW